MNFYKELNSNHLDANNIYPQVVNYSLSLSGKIINKEKIIINNEIDLPKELIFQFYLDENTRLTDVLSFANSFGENMVVSPRFKELMESFNIQESNFYKAKVSFQSKDYDYFFWLPKALKLEGVDFEKSEFMNCFYNRKKIRSVNILDEESYVKSCHDMKRGLILAEKLYFNDIKYYTIIICRLWALEGIYFSPIFIQKILDLKYTGLEFSNRNVIELPAGEHHNELN